MTAPARRLAVEPRPPLRADAPLVTEEDVDVALMFVPDVPLTETEARFDLSRSTAPQLDSWWAARWGWHERDVDTLRTTDWRKRPELPTPAGQQPPLSPHLQVREDEYQRATRRFR